MSVEKDHELKETIEIDIMTPGHEARSATPLFTSTRKDLLKATGNRCFACDRTEEESGHPLEAHHYFIERSLAEGVDWNYLCKKIKELKSIVDRAADFCDKNPDLNDIYEFVDNMMANGLILCKQHHTSKEEGIHNYPYPLWEFFSIGKSGFDYIPSLGVDGCIVHANGDNNADNENFNI